MRTQKRSSGEQMANKKCRLLCILVLCCALVLAACGSETADENTLTFRKDGKVRGHSVTDFPEETYNAVQLENEIEEAIAQYNADAGEKRIKLLACRVAAGKATCTLQYESVQDYADFNLVTIMSGLLTDMVRRGEIDPEVELLTPDMKYATTPETILAADENPDDLTVLVLEEAVRVDSFRKPVYMSRNVTQDETGIVRTSPDGGLAYIVYGKA